MIDMHKLECADLLHHALVGRLSLISPEGRPYTIPLRFVWHGDAIYVRIGYDGRKQDSLAFARHVCFETDQVAEDFSYYASVIIEGMLLDVHDEAEKRDSLVAMNTKYQMLAGIPSPGGNPVVKGVAMRKIAVESLSGRKSEPEVPDIFQPEKLGLHWRVKSKDARAATTAYKEHPASDQT